MRVPTLNKIQHYKPHKRVVSMPRVGRGNFCSVEACLHSRSSSDVQFSLDAIRRFPKQKCFDGSPTHTSQDNIYLVQLFLDIHRSFQTRSGARSCRIAMLAICYGGDHPHAWICCSKTLPRKWHVARVARFYVCMGLD